MIPHETHDGYYRLDKSKWNEDDKRFPVTIPHPIYPKYSEGSERNVVEEEEDVICV